VHAIWRLTALAILAGLLALPVLGLANTDPCCAGMSPCAPGAAPCESLGPVPCCQDDRGAAGASETRVPALPDLGALPALRPLAREPREKSAECGEPRGAASALRLSVVLRI
jgi:hypothetical protein